MLETETMNSKDIFENPFEDINANVLDPRQIVEYWCSPFERGILNDFDEHMFRTCKVPIILQGSRGSGKTTILKYFSYPAQLERAEKKKVSLLSVITDEKEVGFYYRCDDSFISTFKSIFQSLNPDGWTKIFDNYLELIFCKNILELYCLLVKRGEFIPDFEQEMIQEILKDTSLSGSLDEYSMDCLYKKISEQVYYINDYKNRSIFVEETFEPEIILELFSISGEIVNQIKKHIPALSNVLFVFMFDEFENLTHELQRRFNTLIKFARDDISLRIGRRSEGIITNETVNDVEYLRENNDYYLASLDREVEQKDGNNLREYFLGIAQKRFLTMQKNNGANFELLTMFGDKENLDAECREVCRGRITHLQYVLREDAVIAKNDELCEQIIQIIRNVENPIAETINALWVIRSRKDKIETAEQVARTMNSFFSDKKDIHVKKYAADYNNKYRYAITVFLCSVYKKDKLYYGFNAISYLSNGNPRTFINLCRTIISDAYFFEKKKFLEMGTISKETQSKAIHNFAKSEFDEICSIIKYGESIRTLILNIGNIFSDYHKDRKVRYPETNQFYFDEMSLYENDKEIIKTALSWSMIIKKERAQRITAGDSKKGDLYHINKVFYPIFNISYRTRGGVNPKFDRQQMHDMLIRGDIASNIVNKGTESATAKRKTKPVDNGQLSIFDLEDFSDGE